MQQKDIENGNPTALIMDPKHPGIHDKTYIERRNHFFDVSREARVQQKEIPKFDYTKEEDEIWQYISGKLVAAHDKRACQIYRKGKAALDFDRNKMPHLRNLNQALQKQHSIQLVPAEGLLTTNCFHHYLSQKILPCTQFLRHGSEPEYTPEPDAVHDVIGHIPPLMDNNYVALMQLIGHGVNTGTPEQIEAWGRVYWFAIEFGMIQEERELKAFGAGLLSSFGEIEYCFTDNVLRRPFDIEEVIQTAYDPTRMQDLLFVIPSLDYLREQVLDLLKRFNTKG